MKTDYDWRILGARLKEIKTRPFSEFVKKTGRKTLTPKAFAIIRGEKKDE